MNSRMDKYENETPELKKRTERNKELYQTYDEVNYDKFDINSNISVLQNNAREIDVNQIRDMLDKKYRDNIPQRKSFDIPNFDNNIEQDSKLDDTKEYDLNSILSKIKNENEVDYDTLRLNQKSNNESLIKEINQKYGSKTKEDEETELKELINTITQLELKNSNKDAELLDLASTKTQTKDDIIPKKSAEEDFYTGNLSLNEKDFEDFADMQKDIKSNSIFIKILVFIFIIIFIGIAIFIANNVFDLGLFN